MSGCADETTHCSPHRVSFACQGKPWARFSAETLLLGVVLHGKTMKRQWGIAVASTCSDRPAAGPVASSLRTFRGMDSGGCGCKIIADAYNP